MKTCKRCGTEKPLEDFNANKKTKDGKQFYCRECQRELNRNRDNSNYSDYQKAWRESHREKARDYVRQYRARLKKEKAEQK